MNTSRINTILHFFRRLQGEPLHVRRRWLFGLTALSMLIVTSAWVGFLTLSTLHPSPATEQAAAPRSGIGAVFAAGLAVTTSELRSLAGSFIATVSAPLRSTTDVTIEREAYTFQLGTLPPIPPTPLP